ITFSLFTSPVNKSYNCFSGKFSSISFGSDLHYPGSCCVSWYPINLVYSTDRCSPSTCQLSSSLYSGCQETCCEPTSCQTSCVVSGPCRIPCYHPRTSFTLCSPCLSTYSGSLGSGSSSSCSLGYGSMSCYSLGCSSSGFQAVSCGFKAFSYPSCRSIFSHSTSLLEATCSIEVYFFLNTSFSYPLQGICFTFNKVDQCWKFK
uniref:Keratin-associated protein n=1 Tax=Rhinolophus ferrumequinum TaxID=59479 RepID=A0A671EPQ5_RHIFE